MTNRLCAVLGDPIEHSLSPALHRAAYADLGLDWEYQRHRVDADGLAGFVAGLDGRWRGLSCTMPLKEAVMSLGTPSRTAALVGVGNTLILDDATVHNTDVEGLQQALRHAGMPEVRTVTLIGSGATARSALVALVDLGATAVTVLARRAEPAAELAALARRIDPGVEVTHLPWQQAAELGEVDLAVATTVAGAIDPWAELIAERSRFVFDVLYDPWPTPLASAAQAHGRTVVNGLDLLVHQAVGQVRLMTGREVDPAVLMSAGQEALSGPRPK